MEPAASYYAQALTLAGELAMQPLAARCHFGLGRLHARAGERTRALEHLAGAMTMFRNMGMSFWLDKAESALEEINAR